MNENRKQAPGIQGLVLDEPLIFELGSKGRRAVDMPGPEQDEKEITDGLPGRLVRRGVDHFPEIGQVELVRHYTRLSQYNYGVDTGFYPLGSCTMKYNPKVNEDAAGLPGFTDLHPSLPTEQAQGALELMYELERFLAEITGMSAVTLQPSAGAHGELTGMMMVRALLRDRGQGKRHKVLIPDTAHGTNPASVSMCGFTTVPVKSGSRGMLETDQVRSLLDDETAAVMITNPNTLGIFEENICDIADAVHSAGGLVYCDGANLNALMGIVRYGDTGCDLVHMNLHKTFSTPHGGGGPGAGPLAVSSELEPFLPVPAIEKKKDGYGFTFDRPRSIGKVRSYWGNFLICVRAYTYILAMGPEGLKQASQTAVANASYLRKKLEPLFHLPYSTPTLHECVFTDKLQQPHGVSTLDIAKALIDKGFHPPTIYFPLVVGGALMMEPTETETVQTLDRFVEAMRSIASQAESDPESLKHTPRKPKITRVDEVAAARKPVLRWSPDS
jgi:glycine dehydrogenase subunit 2